MKTIILCSACLLPNNVLYRAVAPMDYVNMSHLLLKFEECDTRRCVSVAVNNDMTLEKVESFYVYGNLNTFLPFGGFFAGIYGIIDGEIKIMDDNECKNYIHVVPFTSL